MYEVLNVCQLCTVLIDRFMVILILTIDGLVFYL